MAKKKSPQDRLLEAVYGKPLDEVTKEDIERLKEKYPDAFKEKEPELSETDRMFNNALDIITDLTDGDPEFLCGMVMEGEPDWCDKNCTSNGKIPRICLVKALKYYKKED